MFWKGSQAQSQLPTSLPSGPSVLPSAPTQSSTLSPSVQPTYGSTVYCDPYSASNTDFATSSYAKCYFYACPGEIFFFASYSLQTNLFMDQLSGTQLYFQISNSIGNNYVVLQDNIGSQLIAGYPLFYYTTISKNFARCQTYTLLQGCYYNFACSATIKIAGGYWTSSFLY